MIRNTSPIAILLAAYNGHKYIREQLDSLFAQSFKNWILYVRDDGSTDDTLAILHEYAGKYGHIVICDNGNRHLGARDSFMNLLEQVDSPYYMFMDEDDIWLPHKIENEYRAINKLEAEKPALVLTNLKLVDGNLNVTAESFWKINKFSPHIFNSFRYQAYLGYATGCTMMFNKEAKDASFPMPDYAPMHDWWVTVAVYRNKGNITFIAEPQMLYRKHGDNTTGDFVASQAGKSMTERIAECRAQYRLLKSCGCVSNPVDYLLLKRHINKLRSSL